MSVMPVMPVISASSAMPAMPPPPPPKPLPVETPAEIEALPPPLAPSTVREGLLAAINAEREKEGGAAVPLRLSPVLSTVAQARAEQLAAAGDINADRGSQARLDQAMRQAGYRAQRWIESEISSGLSLPEVAGYWRRQSGTTFSQVVSRDFRDVGIGVASLEGRPLYTLFFAVPEHDYYAERTAALKDLAAVRKGVLDLVNAERSKAGVPPLRLESRLSTAAQNHAEDMLAREYFAHASPEGRTVIHRAATAWYQFHMVGENIAHGQLSVEQVVKGWMESPEHRRNILDHAYIHMGLGLALGETSQGFEVEWVQTFGRP
jgi:uncharacterized protein YkwD